METLKHFLTFLILFFPLKACPDTHENNLEKVVHISRLHQFDDPSLKSDFFRHFVYSNSIHLIDQYHLWEPSTILDKCLDTFFEGSSPPHAACTPRAMTLASILNHDGIKTRLVHTYSSKYENVRGHTFLEFYNDQSGKWETQDPDFDIAIVLRGDKSIRLSTEEATRIGTDKVSPFSFSKEKLTWETIDVHLRNFYEALYIPSEKRIIINSKEFDLEKIFTDYDGIKFIDWCKTRYGNIQIEIF